MNDFTLTVQGAEVPKVGYGTWQVTGRDAEEGVEDAIGLGYRHIDTARAYENEREVGRGIAAAGVPREELWITSKVWISAFEPDRAKRSTERSLEQLGLDRLDLYLLHWPNPDVPLEQTLTALDEQRQQGLIRHLGVSNFPSRVVEQALEIAPVFANQVEFHPYLAQPKLLAQAQEHDLLLEAYSPFAHGHVHEDATLAEIGERHGKTAGQVALRWLLDHDTVCALPKASSSERRAQNLDVFDFALSDEERARVAGLDRGLRTANPSFAPDWD